MSDGITDAINACKKEEQWEKVIHPYVKNHLLGKHPEDLTPKENYWMYIHYRRQESKKCDDIRNHYNDITMPFWDAYIGQGSFRHVNHRNGTRSVKRKKND